MKESNDNKTAELICVICMIGGFFIFYLLLGLHFKTVANETVALEQEHLEVITYDKSGVYEYLVE